MKFSRNNLLMPDRFLEDNATQNVLFLICLHCCITSNNCNNVVSPVDTPKKEIPGVALELCHDSNSHSQIHHKARR